MLQLASSVTLGAIGYGVYLALPVILAALSGAMHLTEQRLGWLASVELLGLTLGSLATGRWLTALPSRRIALVALLLGLSLDAASTFAPDFRILCALRLVAGLAEGACYSLCLASLAWFGDINRNSSVLGVGLVLTGSAEIAAVPWIAQHFGGRSTFLLLAFLYALPACLLRWFPSPANTEAGTIEQSKKRPLRLPQLMLVGTACLLAIAVFNMSQTAFWTFVDRLGTAAAGLQGAFVANALNVSNLTTLVSSWLAWLVATRIGRQVPQIVGLLVIAVLLATWHISPHPLDFAIRLFLWFQIFAICIVLQIGTLGALDRSGRLVAFLPAAQGVGQCTGPLAASVLFGMGYGFQAQLLAQAGLLVVSALIFAAVHWWLRRREPALAR